MSRQVSLGGRKAFARNGLLVVNGFIESAKFEDLYRLLLDAFRRRGIGLKMLRSTDFVSPVGVSPFKDLKGLKDFKGFKDLNDLEDKEGGKLDFVLFWDKDVALARRFEATGVRVYNSADAIAACDDKILTALALARAGLPMPATIVAPMTFEGIGYAGAGFRDWLRLAGERLGFPLVVKEACGSFGAQVYLAKSPAELESRVADIGYKRFLLQEYVGTAERGGRDLRVNVVAGEAVATILRENPRDFRSNITNGGTASVYEPSPAVAALAVAAAKAVGADFAGVDILLPEGREPLVCEVNSNPSFRSTLDATGVNLADSIVAAIAG